jgi:hypothetical protein
MVHHFALVGSTMAPHCTSQPHTSIMPTVDTVAPPSGTPLKTQLFELAKI